jgi:predicted alpha/beta-fold hydrolase
LQGAGVSEPVRRPFRAYPLTAGGHVQTLLGHWLRRFLVWDLPAEDLVVDAEPGVRILTRASWHPGRREEHGTLVLVHGLGGTSERGYMVSAGRLAWQRGWHVVRMNLRGAGESESRYPGLYNSGLDSDLRAVLGVVAHQTPLLAVGGFSLGGNLALLAVGRAADQIPEGLATCVAVCPPVDLEAGATALERRDNRHYQRYFVTGLCAAYERIQRLRPDLFQAGLERGICTVREFDERITAPYGGFASAAEYYARSSSGPHIASIERPTLILAAEDDPFVPADVFSRCRLPSGGAVRLEIARTGGHMGFVGPTAAPGRFWAAERLVTFIDEMEGGRCA